MKNTESIVLKPFSEPRPFPEPTPPFLIPGARVIPSAIPNVKPTKYAYDPKVFERFFAPCRGKVGRIFVKKGEHVEQNATVMTVETGNTSFEVRASIGGTVREVNCKEQDDFGKNDILYMIMGNVQNA